MVVLKPMLEGERVRVCTKCGCMGIESLVKERSSFRYMKTKNMHVARCRVCESVYKRARGRRMSETDREVKRLWGVRQRELREQDPKLMEEWRESKREEARRRRASEDGRRRMREAQRRYQAKKRNDPEWVECQRENARIAYRLRQERVGNRLPIPKVEEVAPNVRRSGELRIGPLRCWVEYLVRKREWDVVGSNDPEVVKRFVQTHQVAIEGAVAELLGLDEKRLWRIRNENQTTREEVVDFCTLREGSVRTADLYPEVNDSPVQSCGRWLATRVLFGLWYGLTYP